MNGDGASPDKLYQLLLEWFEKHVKHDDKDFGIFLESLKNQEAKKQSS